MLETSAVLRVVDFVIVEPQRAAQQCDIGRFRFVLTRLPPRDVTLDGRLTRKLFGLSRVQPIYLSILRPS